jgi:hypothetical protein
MRFIELQVFIYCYLIHQVISAGFGAGAKQSYNVWVEPHYQGLAAKIDESLKVKNSSI